MMVYRGPQWVQLVNGYPKRRFDGSPKSRQHSSQVPASGGTSANAPLSSRLPRIENPSPPRTSISETVISFISANLGGSSFSALEKFIERRSAAFDLNGDARRRIEDKPTQPERSCRLVHERSKPHALHDASHQDVLASDRFVKSVGLGG